MDLTSRLLAPTITLSAIVTPLLTRTWVPNHTCLPMWIDSAWLMRCPVLRSIIECESVVLILTSYEMRASSPIVILVFSWAFKSTSPKWRSFPITIDWISPPKVITPFTLDHAPILIRFLLPSIFIVRFISLAFLPI